MQRLQSTKNEHRANAFDKIDSLLAQQFLSSWPEAEAAAPPQILEQHYRVDQQRMQFIKDNKIS